MLVGVNTIPLDAAFGDIENARVRNLVPALKALRPDLEVVVFTNEQNHGLYDGCARELIESRSGVGSLLGAGGAVAKAAKRLDVDLLFTALSNAPRSSSMPIVLHVLDLLEYETAAQRGGWRSDARLKSVSQLCSSAAGILAPSGFVQERLLELLGVGLDRVTIAPLGVGDVYGEAQSPMAQKPYILTVGDTHEYGNLSRLRKALSHLREEIPHSLVVVGRSAEAEPDAWGPRVMRVDRCGPAQLASLYQHCDLFVCPSLHDATGLRVLEAMRAGTRVAAACVGGIPEMGKNIPVFFNPENVGSIVGTIRRVLNEDPAERETLIRVGRQIAAQYTWERCAEKTLACFERALGKARL